MMTGKMFLNDEFQEQENTDLTEADLIDSYNYFFDPGKNKCRDARLSQIEGIDMLRAYGIIIE